MAITTGPNPILDPNDPTHLYGSDMLTEDYIAMMEQWVNSTQNNSVINNNLPTDAFSQFYQKNKTSLMLGVGVLIVLLVVGGRR